MKKVFIFVVEVPYWRMSIGKAQLFFKDREYAVECDGDKKILKLRFLFKEVKFSD